MKPVTKLDDLTDRIADLDELIRRYGTHSKKEVDDDTVKVKVVDRLPDALSERSGTGAATTGMAIDLGGWRMLSLSCAFGPVLSSTAMIWLMRLQSTGANGAVGAASTSCAKSSNTSPKH